ncbi:hypothetical protein J6590_062513 [Homalodisca vitripennis]|nr:hypothetical protein J6590_062513 [Homalodisca vitripennis]
MEPQNTSKLLRRAGKSSTSYLDLDIGEVLSHVNEIASDRLYDINNSVLKKRQHGGNGKSAEIKRKKPKTDRGGCCLSSPCNKHPSGLLSHGHSQGTEIAPPISWGCLFRARKWSGRGGGGRTAPDVTFLGVTHTRSLNFKNNLSSMYNSGISAKEPDAVVGDSPSHTHDFLCFSSNMSHLFCEVWLCLVGVNCETCIIL